MITWADAPWTLRGPSCGFASIYGGDGRLVFGIAAGSDEEKRSDEECALHARLLLAAPEMAELLQDFGSKTILPDGSVIGLDRHDFERCRAILARIKGETP